MKSYRFFILLTINLAGFGISFGAEVSKGDVKAWKSYQNAGAKALKAKDTIEAERQFTLAVAEAEQLPKGEGKLRESLDDLAPLLLSHRKYDQAQLAYERLCALYAKDLGSNHLRVAASLVDLGQARYFGNRLEAAEQAFLRARKIIEPKSGALHPDMIYVNAGLAAVYRDSKRYAESEALYKTAIQIAESPQVKTEFTGMGYRQLRYQPQYALAAGLMNDLALTYQAQSRLPEAEAMLKRTLKSYEDAKGAQSAGAGLALHNLGILYLSQKNFPEAERSLSRALVIREKAFGTGHPAVAETLEALAAAIQGHDPDQAGTLRGRARQIRANGH